MSGPSPPVERSTEDGNLNGEIPTGITQRTKDRAHVTVDNPAPRTELTRVLTRYDVAALMINRMVGVGIFTNPSLVLWFCGSQWLALGMWFIGGLFSCLCFSIYVEYGNAWPFNGGELLYIDRIFRRLPRLQYLPGLAYSVYQLTLGTAYPNSFGFAKYVLQACNPHTTDPHDLNPHAVKGVAVTVVTAVTLVLYRHKWMGLRFNRLFAIYKVILLLAISIIGYRWRLAENEWTLHTKGSKPISALFVVLFSYQGWEIPFYVVGEVESSGRALKFGGLMAILLVTILYMMVNIAVMVALPFDKVVGDEGLTAMMNSPRGKAIAAAFFSLSPVGNILASTYAYSQVGREIGMQKLIPIWKILCHESTFSSPTRSGAYLVHWVVCTIGIIVVATPYTEGRSTIALRLYTYGRTLVVAIICGSLYWTVKQRSFPLMNRFVVVSVTASIVIVNVGIIVLTMIPSQQSEGTPSGMWLQPTIAFGTMALGMIWALALWPLENPFQRPLAETIGDLEARREIQTSAPDPSGIVIVDNAGTTPSTARTTDHAAQVSDPLPNWLQRIVGVAFQIKPEDPNDPFPEKYRGQTRMVTYQKIGDGGILGILERLQVRPKVQKTLWGFEEPPTQTALEVEMVAIPVQGA